MRIIYILPLLLILSFPPVGICKDPQGTIYGKSHKATGHWRYDRGTEEIVIFDNLHRETGRMKKNSYGGFNVYDEDYNKVGEIEGEQEW